MPDAIDHQRRAYLGTGWASPIRVSLQGGIQLSSYGRSVEESIWIILRTDLGERVYRPDFGSRLSELMFAPLNTQTLLLLRLYVQEALERWEPRIVLEEVQTDPDPIRGRVEITVHYRLKAQHDIRSLVYPFYLVPPEAEE
jgi:uncharacterized protein